MCGVDLILGVSFLCYHTGVKSVLVSLLAQKAEVKFDPAYLIPSQIANKIMELGYVATVMETETAGQNTIEIAVSCRIIFEARSNIFPKHLLVIFFQICKVIIKQAPIVYCLKCSSFKSFLRSALLWL